MSDLEASMMMMIMIIIIIFINCSWVVTRWQCFFKCTQLRKKSN